MGALIRVHLLYLWIIALMGVTPQVNLQKFTILILYCVLSLEELMTPTLIGRWQTRLLLFATVGVLVSLPFCFGYFGAQPSWVYLWILGYIAVFGIVWDWLYIYLQNFRWDRDWPGIFQLLAGIWEIIFLVLLVKVLGLPGIPQDSLDLKRLILHYSLVWVAIYIASQSLMRILWPHWRFRGGRWF
jgi:hypothetical protein